METYRQWLERTHPKRAAKELSDALDAAYTYARSFKIQEPYQTAVAQLWMGFHLAHPADMEAKRAAKSGIDRILRLAGALI